MDELPLDFTYIGPAWDLNEIQHQVREACSNGQVMEAGSKLDFILARTHSLALTGDIQQAAAIAGEVLAQQVGPWAAAAAQISLGICHAHTNLDAAETSFRNAIELARAATQPSLIEQALFYLASTVHIVRGRYSLALSAMDEAQAYSSQSDGQDWKLVFVRGLAAHLTGDRVRLRRALDEMLPHVQPASYIAGLYYYLWACLSMEEGDFAKVEEYLRLTQRIAARNGVFVLDTLYRIQFARMFRLSGRTAEARDWAEDALKQVLSKNSIYYQGLAEIELALANQDLGDYKAAENILKGTIQRLETFQAGHELARARFLLAALYHRIEHPEKSIAWVDAAKDIVRGGFGFILEQERPVAFPLLAYHQRSRDLAARAAADSLFDQLLQQAPPPLRVNGLGGFTVWQGRQRIPDSAWTRRKSGELFRYLLLRSYHSAAREEVFEDIWPDSLPSAAQDLFHQATSTLRHALEPDLPDKFPSRYLLVEGDRVTLNLPAGSQIDFEQFEREMPQAISSGNIDRLERALRTYIGELYPMDRYNGWSAGRRDALTDLYLRGLLALGDAFSNRGIDYQALQCARKAIQLDSWNEDAVFLGMRALIRLQDVPHALRLYNDLQQVLKRDLDVQPRADLRELAQSLQSGNLAGRTNEMNE